ncbi:hypothetical protein HPB52_010991 [Rhipicephalus sanguineus]|uniref:Uncharacterized protein n=1 Tax=Rhipicephalus sanguineus TaxID=34632 RepID=A0A9D4SS55_RHISA|nr:hypothetical protein HPB52_010991 [Rhipicephalus sanguineus]
MERAFAAQTSRGNSMNEDEDAGYQIICLHCQRDPSRKTPCFYMVITPTEAPEPMESTEHLTVKNENTNVGALVKDPTNRLQEGSRRRVESMWMGLLRTRLLSDAAA